MGSAGRHRSAGPRRVRVCGRVGTFGSYTRECRAHRDGCPHTRLRMTTEGDKRRRRVRRFWWRLTQPRRDLACTPLTAIYVEGRAGGNDGHDEHRAAPRHRVAAHEVRTGQRDLRRAHRQRLRADGWAVPGDLTV